MNKAKRIAANGALFAAAVLLACAMLELGVRLAMPQEDIAEWFAPHPVYGHFLKPDFRQDYAYPGGFVMRVQTNSLGLRDVEHDFSAPFPGKTLLLLGDSFVFGYGVNVEDRLDTRLRNTAGEQYRTINAGVPGWGTASETRFALDNLALFQPDTVVLVFCGNDPENDRGVGLPSLPDTQSALYRPKYLLRRHTHTYRLLLKLAAQRRHATTIQTATEALGNTAHVDAQSAGLILEEDWQRTKDTIRSFYGALLAQRPGIPLVIIATNPGDAVIRDNLAELDNGSGLHFLDWAEHAAELTPEERRTPWDGHWSPAMHERAAHALHTFLQTLPHFSAPLMLP